MGAIYGKANVVEIVRLQKTPYWRISETAEKRAAGNHVVTADFSVPDLGLEYSIDMLRTALNRLSAGRYLFSAFLDPAAKRGGVDTWIEIEPAGHLPNGGIGAVPVDRKAYIEGIGEVTIDNIGEAIEKKYELMRKKEAEEKRVKDLEEENRKLKAAARSHETGINQGLLSIGAIVWNMMRGTEAGKEVIGMMAEMKKMNTPTPGAAPAGGSAEPFQEAEIVSDHVSGAEDAASKAMVDALDVLAAGNPELVSQLQMLAKLKKDDPDLFQDAIENLKTIAG